MLAAGLARKLGLTGARRRSPARRAATGTLSLNFCAQGGDWNGQVKLGNNEFYGVNYLQSVTPSLALGGEAFWLGQQRKSGAGFAARHADAAHVATCQVATTGLVSLTYLQKVSEKARPHPGARCEGAPCGSPRARARLPGQPARDNPTAGAVRLCGAR
jgi:hypothetical protein